MRERSLGAIVPSFGELFGRDPEAAASAPGRVNLIGEHTDYNGGYVFPTGVPQSTLAEVALRDDNTVKAWSADVEDSDTILEYTLGAEARGRGWLDYVQGVTHALAAAGYPIRGFDLRVASDVLVGVGLASSA